MGQRPARAHKSPPSTITNPHALRKDGRAAHLLNGLVGVRLGPRQCLLNRLFASLTLAVILALQLPLLQLEGLLEAGLVPLLVRADRLDLVLCLGGRRDYVRKPEAEDNARRAQASEQKPGRAERGQPSDVSVIKVQLTY